MAIIRLKLVEVTVKGRQLWGQSLTDTDTVDNLTELGLGVLEITTIHKLPVIELKLGEGVTRGSLGEGLGETEGLGHREHATHVGNTTGVVITLGLDGTTTHGHDVVDGSNNSLGAGNVGQENGLLECGLRQIDCSVSYTASSGGDLSHTSVDSISVKSHVIDD